MVDINLWQRHEFKFNGEKVSMELRKMDVFDNLELMGFNKESSNAEQIELTKKIFVNNIRNIENLTINKEQIQPAQLVTIIELQPLSDVVLKKIIDISRLQKADEKNSSGQST